MQLAKTERTRKTSPFTSKVVGAAHELLEDGTTYPSIREFALAIVNSMNAHDGASHRVMVILQETNLGYRAIGISEKDQQLIMDIIQDFVVSHAKINLQELLAKLEHEGYGKLSHTSVMHLIRKVNSTLFNHLYDKKSSQGLTSINDGRNIVFNIIKALINRSGAEPNLQNIKERLRKLGYTVIPDDTVAILIDQAQNDLQENRENRYGIRILEHAGCSGAYGTPITNVDGKRILYCNKCKKAAIRGSS